MPEKTNFSIPTRGFIFRFFFSSLWVCGEGPSSWDCFEHLLPHPASKILFLKL